jgi:hypothetical protein
MAVPTAKAHHGMGKAHNTVKGTVGSRTAASRAAADPMDTGAMVRRVRADRNKGRGDKLPLT